MEEFLAANLMAPSAGGLFLRGQYNRQRFVEKHREGCIEELPQPEWKEAAQERKSREEKQFILNAPEGLPRESCVA